MADGLPSFQRAALRVNKGLLLARSHSWYTMDLVYMSDAISYHSARGPIYQRYDLKPSLFDNKMEKIAQSKDIHRSEGKCRICKEKQRRKLAAYIRNKCSNSNSKENQILEEEEEDNQCVGKH